MAGVTHEIRKDEDGQLDEVVVTDPTHVHVERMDEGAWWIGIAMRDGGRVMIDLSTKRPGRTQVTGLAEVER